jgi:hypothetical protein
MDLLPFKENLLKIRSLCNSLRFCKTKRCHTLLNKDYTANRFLPFALLLLRTCRPDFVRIRIRNP